MTDQPHHPGYGPNPPADRPAYTPEQPAAGYPQPAGYQQPPAGYAQPGQPHQQQPHQQQPHQQQPHQQQPHQQQPHQQQPHQQQPHQQQPHQQAPQYSQPGFGSGNPYAAPRGSRNTLGLVSAILAAAAVVLNFVLTLIQASLVYSAGPGMVGVVSGVQTVIGALLAIGAVVTGALGLRRRDRGALLGAMGLGAGVVILVGALSGLLYPLIVQASFDLG